MANDGQDTTYHLLAAVTSCPSPPCFSGTIPPEAPLLQDTTVARDAKEKVLAGVQAIKGKECKVNLQS